MNLKIDRLEERIAPSRAMLEKLFAEISQLQADAQQNVAQALSDAGITRVMDNGHAQQSAVVQGGDDVTVVSQSSADGPQSVTTSNSSTPVVVVRSSGDGVVSVSSSSVPVSTVLVNNNANVSDAMDVAALIEKLFSDATLFN